MPHKKNAQQRNEDTLLFFSTIMPVLWEHLHSMKLTRKCESNKLRKKLNRIKNKLQTKIHTNNYDKETKNEQNRRKVIDEKPMNSGITLNGEKS